MQPKAPPQPQRGGRMPPTPPADVSSATSQSSSSSSADSDGESVVSSVSSYPLPPPRNAVEVQEQDKKTPDHHVSRDPRLIRLTGVHPFNCEAPLTELFNQGFLTSPELFYVRNHGAVPEVQDEEILNWELSIEGEVAKPFKITFKDLLEQYKIITAPITLVCAGNRRKEQNVVRKTKGFSWGPAGVSTALFTGIAMRDVIRSAKPKRKARYVCMEGADKLPNGYYGTSVKLNWVMDPNRGIMLAHMMNGEALTPDHGRPLRAVIPGQIGGRSVKWLTRLIVTEEPSDNWYHIYDNRVLPTNISPEDSANAPETWKDERYAIYDLNPNSAIASPAHGEQLNLSSAPEKYRLRGYAYAGGGRRITRTEITLDKGKTWRQADLDYPEDLYRDADETAELFGGSLDVWWRESCFCWCFWHLDVDVTELADAQDIFVRCMDEGMAAQPRDMYWSVLGMMNNPWFRVVVHKEDETLRFEHPTQPALMPGGWMERLKKSGGNLTNGFWGEQVGNEPLDSENVEEVKEIKMTKDDVKREINIEEFWAHEIEEEPWFVLNGEVYDGTGFLKEHPGGAQSILSAAATDATDEFMAIHSETAKAMMPDYHIGTLDKEAKAALSKDGEEESTSDPSREVFLHHKIWNKAVLEKKVSVSWDTRIFTFKLDHENQQIGLPTGKHLMIRLRDPATREAIIRPYTPTSHEKERGWLDVLVKIYFDNKDRKGGKMSQALDGIPIGHFVDFKGPIGKMHYLGGGRCTLNDSQERTVNKFVMISGGSGITPIFQILRSVLEDENDPTQCVVLNGNRLEEDILCRTELDQLVAGNSSRCQLYHTLTQPTDTWKGLKGRIAAPLLKEHCPVANECMALVCGPEPMEKSVHAALLEMGWKEEDLLFF